MKILANDGISPSGAKKITEYGYELILDTIPQEDLITYINENNVSAILVRSATKVRKDIIDSCPSLKFIGRGGVGMDNIDVEYGRSKGITVNNTPAASSQSVAELVLAQMLSSSRFTHWSNQEMPEKGASEFKVLKKKYAKGVELRGKTLGIIGFGRIGRSLAKYALGCGMNILAHDKDDIPETLPVEFGNGQSIDIKIEAGSFDDVITKSDYISIHIPKQSDGAAVIGEHEINKMKDGVRLFNAARGGVIDEDALLKGLDSNKIAFCMLDVFENEPNPRKDLLNNPRIITTPHIGAATLEAQDRIGIEMADLLHDTLG
ncbi:MAG: D-2-hydroxyacid dehydrogenase [Flavobacteriales bacterium]|jgi:D-3-phosphoglycerate dehydrogenase|nr:D-2-hydroxyacid dehydrogenase [Flavobacteriales bacterium]